MGTSPSHTRSSGTVAHTRLPQNAARRFAAINSWSVSAGEVKNLYSSPTRSPAVVTSTMRVSTVARFWSPQAPASDRVLDLKGAPRWKDSQGLDDHDGILRHLCEGSERLQTRQALLRARMSTAVAMTTDSAPERHRACVGPASQSRAARTKLITHGSRFMLHSTSCIPGKPLMVDTSSPTYAARPWRFGAVPLATWISSAGSRASWTAHPL